MTSHTHRPPMRLGPRHKRWLYVMCGSLFLSGLGWLLAHFLFAGPNDFGEPHHASEPWWLRIHGATAMGFLIAFGSLLPGHAARAWQARKNYRSGLFMVGLVATLVLTGYGLYYAGDEQTRPWISAVHWAVGLAAAAGLLLHVYLGKRRARRRRPATPRRPAAGHGNPAAPAIAQHEQTS